MHCVGNANWSNSLFSLGRGMLCSPSVFLSFLFFFVPFLFWTEVFLSLVRALRLHHSTGRGYPECHPSEIQSSSFFFNRYML